MSGFFDEPPRQPKRSPSPQPSQRSRALVLTAIILVALFFLASVFTGVWTDRLWFRSLGYSSVFTKVLGTRVLLFVVFGLLLGVIVAANVAIAYRFRPIFRPASQEQVNLDRYREAIEPLRRWVLIGIAVVLALFAGGSGSGQWRQFLLWRHRQSFGTKDPYFNRDVGFYVFELPWLHYLIDFGMAIIVLSLIAAALTHYLYGGIRLQAKTDKLSGSAQAHLSVLLGLFVLLKAFDYWLDRYDLTTEGGGLFTGMGYTDQNAVLPSKNILTFIALICALLFFANVLRRTWMLPSVGLALLVLSAILLGAIWPGIVQQFQVRPSEPDKEGPYIGRNIEATRSAYDVKDAEVTSYDPSPVLSQADLSKDDKSLSNIRLLDPNLVSDAFEQLQQVRGYYSVPPVLDVDRYAVNGQVRDLVLAVRELEQSGLEAAQQNWANLHTVYTHGFGVIAAYGNQRNADDKPVVDPEGKPVWAEQDIPPRGVLTDMFPPDGYQPRIYFGENSPSYSIVGKPKDGRDVELDIPEGTGTQQTTTTYGGQAGVPVGGIFNKLLYAVKFSEPNIVLSSRVNENSKILYDRTPRQRVEKVAPWLTVDGDVYPAVVDGRVVWIVDGYTTTDRYPNSEKDSLSDMVSDSLQPRTAYATLPTDEINYMRNSVKAVVDAYDGTVTLYEWDKDPILDAWSAAFPGVVRAKSEIPDALLEHMRYPEDLFKVQRKILATYHVEQPKTFYEGSDRWRVPEDPENKTQTQPPYRLSITTPGGVDEPVFSLTSVFVPQERQNLASFISVDADASRDDYGKIRILRLPSNTQVPGPSQIANQFASDQEIQDKLLAFTRTNSKALFGNLLTLPIGDGLLYVQPLYTLREVGEGRYPVLRYVLVSFGQDVGIGTTLNSALCDVLGLGATCQGTTTSTPSEGGGGQGTGTGGGQGVVSQDVRDLLQQAEAKFTKAQAALQAGDLAAYAKATEQARSLVQKAIEAAGVAPEPKAKSGGGGGSSKSG
ncbi:UPF0182 family protein [Nocardioides mesophilus]|uniref:UPF0182 protein H9L09_14705 n=1 Tax=Nocardioides mesophilus TaxID=433659 RepID=A0A7G9R860_9ACTN|nr:UPF0182 family protein [Nocardioides mesophilus]QNN51785.1 UPF0182 family protein [Nocardioides mesophilus]